ncbi:aldehyde dehydrogenase family protein [Mesorhizobium sp. M4A.F.Ca.ET.022.05.2.1]|uniref:aldehyde dehydrogenase family protein n=1 Tax=Mesorhizobium sp. M4A.F.Ca.ET.022.05.2.1 TaxID=2496653 RepID=UPI000FCAF994|nr:aldehyde dehydrogenase family protein [Mesorhizobium sp. M4A.F.Ca.ET.022.05.2.1]RVC82577.1 aldehyde dehydrogenase family protein [Mesorhizobium sp. M4A.F.Ca.ET.022.05.2.1]
MDRVKEPDTDTSGSNWKHPPLGMYVDGEFIESSSAPPLEVINPADEAVLGILPSATSQLLQKALYSAERAFETWPRFSPEIRKEVLERAADILSERAVSIALSIVLEQGKPLNQARLEVSRVVDLFRYYARLALELHDGYLGDQQQPVRRSSKPVPIGVVAAFTAWNFPLVLPGRKLAMALAAGCPVILKAAEETPTAAIELVRALQEAGLPTGYLHLVFGNPADISRELIASPVVRKISLTGSIPVGKSLARLAAEGMKPASMELGGHSAALVFADADIDAAASELAAAKFANAGQVCTAPSRLFIEMPAYDRFVDAFLGKVKSLRIGNGLDPDTDLGPLAHSRRIDATVGVVEDAIAGGAQIITGGNRIRGPGYFFEPTVLCNVAPGSQILRDEYFAPLAPINGFNNEMQAVSMANALPYGLAAYVYTQSPERIDRLIENLEAGGIFVNTTSTVTEFTPFCGVKESGYGYEGGRRGLDTFVHYRLVNSIRN